MTKCAQTFKNIFLIEVSPVSALNVIFYFVIHRWFSRCVVQSRGQELVDGLKACLQSKGRLSVLVEQVKA